MSRAARESVALWATWDVVGETATLLRYRAGHTAALAFLDGLLPRLRLVEYGTEVRAQALAVSFVVVTTLLDRMPSLASGNLRAATCAAWSMTTPFRVNAHPGRGSATRGRGIIRPVHVMNEPTLDVAHRLRGLLERTCPRGLVSAYLFGSHARGRPHRESDVDVAVLLDRAAFPTTRERFEERVRLAGDLGAGPAHPVDVVVLNDAPPQLGRRIVTEGQRIVCFDAEADHAYVRDTLLRAADLEPFLRRMRLVKLAALAR